MGAKLREYRQGRVAAKFNISLYNSGRGAFGGVIFRATIPPNATTKHDAYNAPGIRLFLIKRGKSTHGESCKTVHVSGFGRVI